MTARAIHLHIGWLVVTEDFNHSEFAHALAQNFSQPASGEWAPFTLDRVQLELGAIGATAVDAGAIVAERVRSLASVPAAANGHCDGHQ